MADDWNIYRTRFLVRARQLTQPLVFIDPLGREQRGSTGDYLVQSSEGLLANRAQRNFRRCLCATAAAGTRSAIA
jgi:hypothetical protein